MSADTLGRLLSNSELVARMSGLYDRLKELQWRLRFLAELRAAPTTPAKRPLLEESIQKTDLFVRLMNADFEDLLELVEAERDEPEVDLRGIRREVVMQLTQSAGAFIIAADPPVVTGGDETVAPET